MQEEQELSKEDRMKSFVKSVIRTFVDHCLFQWKNGWADETHELTNSSHFANATEEDAKFIEDEFKSYGFRVFRWNEEGKHYYRLFLKKSELPLLKYELPVIETLFKDDADLLDRIDAVMDRLFCPSEIEVSASLFGGRIQDPQVIQKGRRVYKIITFYNKDIEVNVVGRFIITNFAEFEKNMPLMQAVNILIDGVADKFDKVVITNKLCDASSYFDPVLRQLYIKQKLS